LMSNSKINFKTRLNSLPNLLNEKISKT